MARLKRSIMTFLALLLGLYIVVCLIVYTQQERLLFYPQVLSAEYTFAFSTPFEEVTWETDGATLHALHFKVPQPHGVILYFHGNAGSVRDWGSIAPTWTRHGYDLVIPDYRGFGKSTGTIRNEQMLHDDALVAYDYVKQQDGADRIIVAGRSLGTGIATKLAAEQPTRMLILETPYTSLLNIARRQFPWAPGLLLKYPLHTDQWIGQVQCPVYLIHGTHDQLIPYESSQRLQALISGESQLFTIKGAGHNDFTLYPEYTQALGTILR